MAKIHVLVVMGVILRQTGCLAPTAWTAPSIATSNGTGTLGSTLSETLDVGSKVGTVTLNNVATAYMITSQTYSGMFNVTLNALDGDIYLIDNTYLDYETATSVLVVIQGSNADGVGVADVTITITDENDNTPTFSSSTYTTYIASTFSNDTAIFTVAASDADSTTNNDVTYAITSGDDTTNKFLMVARSGEVKRTGQSFTSNTYSLVITATDSGSSPLTGSTTLTVCIDCSGGVQVMVSALVTSFGILSARMLGTILM